VIAIQEQLKQNMMEKNKTSLIRRFRNK